MSKHLQFNHGLHLTFSGLIVLCLIHLSLGTAWAQPTLQWVRSTSSSQGALASPLLLDVYGPPQYPGSLFFGQEVFVVETAAADGKFHRFRATDGAPVLGSAISLDNHVRSTPTGSYFQGNEAPLVLFGETNGVRFMRQDGTSFVVETTARVDGPPVLADVDNDSWLEVIVLDAGGTLYVWDITGSQATNHIGFPIALGEDVTTGVAPLVGNINQTSALEIVVATENALYVFDRNGQLMSPWPRSFGAPITSSPLAAKIDGFSDETLNLIVTTADRKIWATRLSGINISGWPVSVTGDIDTSPIVIDLNLDSDLEVVFCTSNGVVHAIEGDGDPLPGWPVDLNPVLTDLLGSERDGRLNASVLDPLAVDIDGDFALELLVPFSTNGILFALESDGSMVDGWPLEIGVDPVEGGVNYSRFRASPAIGDIDYDGQLEMITATFGEVGSPGGVPSTSLVKCYELGPTPGTTVRMQWPVFRQNLYRTGISRDSGQPGFAPICDFPDWFGFSPEDSLSLDFSQFVYDIDTPVDLWTCSLNGLTPLVKNPENNYTFTIRNPEQQPLVRTVTATILDPQGRSCSNTFYVVSALKGDVDVDGEVTSADIAQLLNLVLQDSIQTPTLLQEWTGDLNSDGQLDILDVINLVDRIATAPVR